MSSPLTNGHANGDAHKRPREEETDAVRTQVLTFRAADVRELGTLTAPDIGAALRDHGLEVPPDLGAICDAVDISREGRCAQHAPPTPVCVAPRRSCTGLPSSHLLFTAST